jgi:hypothetical protein
MTGATIQNPILEARAAQVEADLAGWAARSPSFDFDPSGSNLFSIMELAHAYSKRASEFVRVIRSMLKDQQLVPAAVMARALTETTAMGCLYLDDMQRLIAAGDGARLEARFKKFYVGVRDGKIVPVHVMDALRHLEKVDEAYFEELSTRHPILAVATKLLAATRPAQDAAADKGLPLVSQNYALLSEVAHPNGTGTQFLYGVPHPQVDCQPLHERLAFLSVAAIWQCHHLIRALQRTQSLPAEFRAKFLPDRA